MEKLVLFDIDGILIKNAHSLERPSETRMLIKKHFGLDVDLKAVSINGMTDRGSLITRLNSAGLKDAHLDPRLEVALNDYVNITKEVLNEFGVEKISGVEDLIKELLKKKITLGVLTGNTSARAKLKLETVNLWHYFKIGAFGHSSAVRSELVPMALKDAKEKTGISFDKKNVFIIGDTIRDIECAKEGGVKVIAVATGKDSIEVLKKENPDFAFRDFSRINEIMKVILG
jgi:phosphoglycolate phosphatase-like HAD superfamily hydrolase